MTNTQDRKAPLSLGTVAAGAIPIAILILVLAYILEIPTGRGQQFPSKVVSLASDGGFSQQAAGVTVEMATGERAVITLPAHSRVGVGDEIFVLRQERFLSSASYEFCHFPDK